VIGLGTDELDLFAMDLLTLFEIEQVPVRPSALPTLEEAVGDAPVAVTVGVRA